MKLSSLYVFSLHRDIDSSSCVQTSEFSNQPPSATVLDNLEIDSDGKARWKRNKESHFLLVMQLKLLNKLPQNQFHHGNRARGTGFPDLLL